MARTKHASSNRLEPVVTYWSTPTGIGRSAWRARRAHHEKVRELRRYRRLKEAVS
jgi:hypothetical protein